MTRAWRIAAVAALVGTLAPSAARALELVTSIDLDYTYEQRNLADAVNATTSYRQIYELKYSTSLTTALDFLTTVKLELEDEWDTEVAGTSRVSPSLEIGTKGDQLAVKFAYSGSLSTTNQFEEDAETEKYSNSADLDVELTPDFWPEVKLKLQDKRDYQLQAQDSTARFAELQLRDEVLGVGLEYRMRVSEDIDVLPVRARSKGSDWALKTTYRRELFGGTDFEVGHEIKETYSEDTERGVFTNLDEDFTQSLKARLKSSLTLTQRLSLVLGWEYEFSQDLLGLEKDYEVKNKYSGDLRYDMFPALKFTASAKRETSLVEPAPGEDSESEVNDSAKAGFDFTPFLWLRFNGKAEFEQKQSVAAGSGGSTDLTEERTYELGMKNKFGTFWDFTVNGSYKESYADGHVDNEEGKLKAALKLKVGDLSVQPLYEGSRSVSWDDVGDPAEEESVTELKLKVDYKIQLFDLLAATFAHEYGTKLTRDYDEVQNFGRELTMNEDTRLNLTLSDLIEGLRVEGELQRKGSDTEDDEDPQLVEVAYTLKLDWERNELGFGSSFQYNDKGDDYDDLTLTTRLAWKTDTFGLSGEYQLVKVYSEETDEERKLNLKLFYKF